MGYDQRVDQRSVLMHEWFHEGSEDLKYVCLGSPGCGGAMRVTAT